MRIFLSHSSRNKPLVREIKGYLPEHIRAWIDETDLLAGENLGRSIKSTIQTATDYLILFVDQYAVSSEWVRQELAWALEQESRLNRVFVLPVVLEKDAWQRLDPAEFRERKYLECYDYTERATRALADNLMNHLFAWISRDLTAATAIRSSEPTVGLLEEADRYLRRVAQEIRSIVHAYNRDNPLSLRALFELLSPRRDLRISSEHEFNELLVRLRQQGLLAGLICKRGNIFVEEEHYAWKTGVYTKDKQLIAATAVNLINSRDIIVLDAGSTTVEIARQIGEGLKLSYWGQLTVVSNSVSAAHELLSVAAEMGLEDDNPVLRFYMAGGRARCNTLATVAEIEGETSHIERVLGQLGGSDLAFVGTNGIHLDGGFTTHDQSEAKTKSAMLVSAKAKYIVTDPSKFGVRESTTFAGLQDGISIITTRGDQGHSVQDYERLLACTATKIVYAN